MTTQNCKGVLSLLLAALVFCSHDARIVGLLWRGSESIRFREDFLEVRDGLPILGVKSWIEREDSSMLKRRKWEARLLLEQDRKCLSSRVN
jgi:hypothetical protein